ncbi:tripartite tricarboxylate transporter substrate binding protein [Rhodoplanes sp. TEM]|uniref:Tripartite tricarboxylate transporter substrate binding protein n=1 Tax=Rhodoplanes tepidamans TaxID=200616 RepID=A0ABT5JHG7_RHOTP|nr:MULTISPECIES: tripartite tricarboxylate transporter substrate binding protein [Rhodoplanes]MDC7789163.1 tripartite tricarboxylate transporter substrate binding protein [Rhodoplanes tepidamans]MDC7987185.1 tripartite tricarboxylate transporter substrate binding protein [Rhodoplanes sp. TEM]MDQ0358533.1 tripartite-type tricarboxylate transporter receptor subunit TctC [Rhodoplanes tepidamans]
MLKGILGALALASTALVPLTAVAQDYPSRPVTLIVPAPPGGGTDVFARQIAEAVEPILKQKVIVDNRAGGGGTVGTTMISAAKPDGYTLGFVWNSPLTTSPHSLTVAYTPDSYASVMSIGYSSYVLCTAPDFPAATGKELIDAVKAAPGKYTYGNDGLGGTMQLAAERIFTKVGAKVRPVPFGGAGETARNFLGGHVTFYGGSLPPILPHAAAGKAKCLLLTSAARNPALPQAAGLDDIGLGSEETVLWWGLIAPARTPPEVLAKLEKAFMEAASTPAFKATMEKQGATQRVLGAKDTGALIRKELAALGEVAKAIGIERKAQ